jgi:hypothetical protein
MHRTRCMAPSNAGYSDRMTNTESSARSPGGSPNEDAKVRDQDVVAWSGLVEEQARRVLASGGPDEETAEAIRRALAQVEADRANGESSRDSTMYLQRMLDRDELRRG